MTSKSHLLCQSSNLTVQSSYLTEEGKFYFLPDNGTETDEQIWERKQKARKKILGNDASSENDTIIFQTKTSRRIPEDDEQSNQNIPQDTSNQNIPQDTRHHQDQDPVLRN